MGALTAGDVADLTTPWLADARVAASLAKRENNGWRPNRAPRGRLYDGGLESDFAAYFCASTAPARMVELVDTTDLNSVDPNGSCGFKSRSGYDGPCNAECRAFFVP